VRSWDKVLEALDVEMVGRNVPSGERWGAWLAMLRKHRGLGQRELAAMVGCRQPAIVKLEGKGRGRVQVLDRVLTVLGAGSYLALRGSRRAFYTHAGNSSGHHGWQTPRVLLTWLYCVFGTFDRDPCSPTASRRGSGVRARMRYT
jgi:hypothetical protein